MPAVWNVWSFSAHQLEHDTHFLVRRGLEITSGSLSKLELGHADPQSPSGATVFIWIVGATGVEEDP